MGRVVGISGVLGVVLGTTGLALSWNRDALELNLQLFWATPWVPLASFACLTLLLVAFGVEHLEGLLGRWRRRPKPLPSLDDKSSREIVAYLRSLLEGIQSAREPDVSFALDLLLHTAATLNASDVHITPDALGSQLTLRVDGRLITVAPLEQPFGRALVSRVKVLSQLRLDKIREPQDGKLARTLAGKQLDLRVSSLPTEFGERLVLRLVAGGQNVKPLSDLGFSPALMRGLLGILERPEGILFVSGPVGSGKTTTLYSALARIHQGRGGHVAIVSLEDPIERRLEFVAQSQIDSAAGRGFAEALRSVLRQDPNVLMLGEIRDHQTAEAAMNAALSGHLILTTVHAASAVGAFMRLRELGVAPSVLAAACAGSLSQRLVRRLCRSCRVPQVPSLSVRQRFEQLGVALEEGTYYEAVGCSSCGDEGFSGRMPIAELLVVAEGVRQALASDASPEHVTRLGRADGLGSLAEEGARIASLGETSLAEVLRVVG